MVLRLRGLIEIVQGAEKCLSKCQVTEVFKVVLILG